MLLQSFQPFSAPCPFSCSQDHKLYLDVRKDFTFSENRHNCLVTSFIKAIFYVFTSIFQFCHRSSKVSFLLLLLLVYGEVTETTSLKDMSNVSSLCLFVLLLLLLFYQKQCFSRGNHHHSQKMKINGETSSCQIQRGPVLGVSSDCPGNEKILKIIYKLHFSSYLRDQT